MQIFGQKLNVQIKKQIKINKLGADETINQKLIINLKLFVIFVIKGEKKC